jgi:hypothetical protein
MPKVMVTPKGYIFPRRCRVQMGKTTAEKVELPFILLKLFLPLPLRGLQKKFLVFFT